MKRLLLGTTALVMLSLPAAAADLATKYPVKAVVAAPAFSWTGFYVGGNIGFGAMSYTADYRYDGASYETYDMEAQGFFGGLQAGYNYQFSNNVVLGIETDFQWSDISGGTDENDYNQYFYHMTASIEYFGTIRARLGYAFDRFLPYLTGGLAYGQVKYEDGDWMGDGTSSASKTQWGWTIGAGFEYALTNNWTVKAEYLYVDLGSPALQPWGVIAQDYDNVTVDYKFSTAKIGVNYKF